MKILLVDDSRSARYALRLKLQRLDVQVDMADSAEAALERIAETPPDAILMDHTMPGMNGLEALEAIKSNPATAHIPVVMCTSHDDSIYAAKAAERGALRVITKEAAQEQQHLSLVLDQIRSVLASAPELIAELVPELVPEFVPEPVPQPVPEPVLELTEAQALTAVPPTTALPPTGPDRAEVESWMGHYLSQHLGKVIEPHLERLAPPTPTGPDRAEVESWMGYYLNQHLGKVVEPHLERLATQLRQVIAEQVEMTVDAMQSSAVPPAAALPPAPTRVEVEEWTAHYLAQHLGTVIKPHLEELDAQLRLVIAEQVEMAVDAIPPPVMPRIAPVAPPVDIEVLRNDVVPSAVQRHFDAERDALLQLIQQSVQESQAAQLRDLETVKSSVQTVDAQSIRDLEAALETALGDTRNDLAALRRGLQLSYWIGAAALVVGIGAAALFLVVG